MSRVFFEKVPASSVWRKIRENRGKLIIEISRNKRKTLRHMPYTALQKYKLSNIFSLDFTAYGIPCWQNPPENYKSYVRQPF